MSVKIAARSLSSGYQGVPAIHDVDLEVRGGEMVLLGGSNGAGKSTTLMTLAGAISPISGCVEHEGQVTTASMHNRVRAGVGVITEHRTVFMGLTVAENLRLGRGSTETALEFFPELEKRMKIKAGLCSGGEQQMLSVGRMLASRPSTILADELSLGLAPIIVQRLLASLRVAADAGSAVLIVEQHVRAAMPFIDRGYFLRRGGIALTGTQEELRNSENRIRETYL